MKKIICICGTSRPDNYTQRALNITIKALEQQNCDVTLIKASALNLGFPGQAENAESAESLQEKVKAADAILLASPEYHGSFSAMTKLIIENLGFPSVLSNKPMALLGVAAGRIGAIKSLEQLKGICSHIGAIVMPGAVSIAGVQGAFEGDVCTSEDVATALEGLAGSILSFMEQYVCPKHILENVVRADDTPWCTSI